MLIDSKFLLKGWEKAHTVKQKRINVVFNNSEIQKEKRVRLRTKVQLPSDRHLG
jgi:hypothetical protein